MNGVMIAMMLLVGVIFVAINVLLLNPPEIFYTWYARIFDKESDRKSDREEENEGK